MTQPALKIENISKQYRIGALEESYETFRDVITKSCKAPFVRLKNILTRKAESAANLEKSFWALEDVSFEVQPGEVVGIIGANGAGKSTLLKILSKITKPTKGRAFVYGRLGALLEVGTGFHPELSGRENIYLNGAILGMSRSEINKKFSAIVKFSGLEKFIDTPIKFYSSGMTVRLAFSVAAHLEPDILIIDEVLAVGDSAFQKRSLGKMEEVASSGRTVLFVSHNMATVSSLCSRAILLQKGKVVTDGPTDQTIAKYMSEGVKLSQTLLRDRIDRQGNGRMRFNSIDFSDRSTNEQYVCTGANVDATLHYEAPEPIENASIAIVFQDILGRILFTCSTRFQDQDLIVKRKGNITFHLNKFPLIPGQYVIKVWSGGANESFDIIENALTLTVHNGDFFDSGKLPHMNKHGSMLINYTWSVQRD